MQRLNNATLQPFIGERGVCAIMFGAPEGEATMAQALEFADAWLASHDEATFGYIDAFDNVAAARAYAVRVLPTTMIARDGEIVAWIEGRHTWAVISSAIGSAARARKPRRSIFHGHRTRRGGPSPRHAERVAERTS